MFSDGLRLAMLISFILHHFLKPCHIKSASLQFLKGNLGVREDQIVPELVGCWLIVAKTTKLAFSSSFTEQMYNDLTVCLFQERNILLKVLQYFLYLTITLSILYTFLYISYFHRHSPISQTFTLTNIWLCMHETIICKF